GVRKGCVVAFGAADPAAGTERLIVAVETRERGEEARRRVAAGVIEQVALAIGIPPDAVKLLAPHTIPQTSRGKLRPVETRRLFVKGVLGASAPPPWLQVARLGTTGAAQAAGSRVFRALELLYGIYAAVVFVLWLVPTWALVSMTRSRQTAARI